MKKVMLIGASFLINTMFLSISECKECNVAQLVSQLPQIYQLIYNHPDLTDEKTVQRICVDREREIISLVEKYLSLTKKKYRTVLDIGCSQGYFCFKLKEHFGDKVQITGIDIDQKNIDLCNALNKENNFDIKFVKETLNNDFVNNIKNDQFDIVMVLGVIHHEARPTGSIYAKKSKGGYAHAKKLLSKLIKKSQFSIIELALREKFRSDFGELPINYMDWFSDIAFSKTIASFHRTTVSKEDRGEDKNLKMRPMIIASDKYIFENGEFYKI